MANVEKFKYWCNKILPLVYDDSLSYYEFLGKVYEKLNETIDAVNSNTEAVAEFDQRINNFIAAETAARESWEDQQVRDRQSWETTETANRAAWENQQALKWAAFQAMFISEYDPDDVYVQGDLCSVQYKMYVANANTTGTFDPTKWDEIVLADYLAAYVAEATEDLQRQYDQFLEDYQRSFGIDDYLGGSTTDAISQRAATAAAHSASFEQPGGHGDLTGKHYNYISGNLITSPGINSGNLIPCRAGQTIYGYARWAPEANPFNQTAITFFDASEKFVTGLSASGSSFTVPNNANIRYVRVPYSEIHADEPTAITFWPVTENPPLFYDLHTVKREVNSKPDALHNLSVDTTKTLDAAVSTDLIHSADLLWPNHDGDITGKHYDYRNGSLITSPNFNAGNLIPCSPGQTFYVFLRSNPSGVPNQMSISFFNSDAEWVSGISLTQNSFTIPNNAAIKYVRVPYTNTHTDAQRLCVSLRRQSADNIPKPFYTLHTVKNEIDAMKNALDGSQWQGKTWYAYGTSITSTERGRYVDPLSDMLGVIAVNKGIAGGGIGDLGSYSHGQVYDAICNTTDGKLNADLITLETGANDTGPNVPLGTIYDTGTSTLAGCLNDCIRYLQTNTTAQIAITVSPATTTLPAATVQYYTWLAMIEQICRINCVAFIPNESNMGYATLNSSHGSNYVLDSIHQTALGGYVFAENIYRYLKTLPTFKTSIPT